jgi:hypothetical protein
VSFDPSPVNDLDLRLEAMGRVVTTLQSELAIRNTLLAEARAILAQVTAIEPDPKCQKCKGSGRFEYLAHGDWHDDACSCTYPSRLGLK